jgi:hypothetical protein
VLLYDQGALGVEPGGIVARDRRGGQNRKFRTDLVGPIWIAEGPEPGEFSVSIDSGGGTRKTYAGCKGVRSLTEFMQAAREARPSIEFHVIGDLLAEALTSLQPSADFLNVNASIAAGDVLAHDGGFMCVRDNVISARRGNGYYDVYPIEKLKPIRVTGNPEMFKVTLQTGFGNLHTYGGCTSPPRALASLLRRAQASNRGLSISATDPAIMSTLAALDVRTETAGPVRGASSNAPVPGENGYKHVGPPPGDAPDAIEVLPEPQRPASRQERLQGLSIRQQVAATDRVSREKKAEDAEYKQLRQGRAMAQKAAGGQAGGLLAMVRCQRKDEGLVGCLRSIPPAKRANALLYLVSLILPENITVETRDFVIWLAEGLEVRNDLLVHELTTAKHYATLIVARRDFPDYPSEDGVPGGSMPVFRLGERVLFGWTAESRALSVTQTYKGSSTGVMLPIGSIGPVELFSFLGRSRGHIVETTSLDVVAFGFLMVTNMRLFLACSRRSVGKHSSERGSIV